MKELTCRFNVLYLPSTGFSIQSDIQNRFALLKFATCFRRDLDNPFDDNPGRIARYRMFPQGVGEINIGEIFPIFECFPFLSFLVSETSGITGHEEIDILF